MNIIYHGNPKPSFLGVMNGYDPYIEGLKLSFFMVLVLVSKGIYTYYMGVSQK